MKRKERLELAEWIKDFSLKSGANQVAVSLSNRRVIEIEFRDKKLDKLKESIQNSLNLNVYVDQKYSGHSTNDLKRDSLKGFIKEAIAGTRYLTQDLHYAHSHVILAGFRSGHFLNFSRGYPIAIAP